MEASKTYTAEELRAKATAVSDMLGDNSATASMLRYAAKVVEKNAKLNARLEAVVNECATPITDVLDTEHDWQELSRFRDMILREARGDV